MSSLCSARIGPALLAVTLIFSCGTFNARGQGERPRLEITRSGAETRLDWTEIAGGVSYTVQLRDAFGAIGLWLPPEPTIGTSWPISGHTWTDLRSPSPAARFYRVLAVPTAQRGRVLSISAATTYTRANIALIFNFAGIPVTPQYDVRSYTVVYETVDPMGGRTVASGSVVLPVGRSGPAPLVSYQHGTIARTNDAPGQELFVGVAFATSGYAAAIPNYLGLGPSPSGVQAFHHARSEGTAGVDFLRATRSVCATNRQALNGRVFLAGYSQGGHATLAMLRELETFHTNEFTVTACAAMAGAYDLSGVTTANVLSGRPQPNPYYFALLIAAYQSVYQLAPTLADLLNSPYNATLPPLLTGNATGTEINEAMPSAPAEILKPDFLASFTAIPEHPLRLALRDNDLYRWRPRAPLRLLHCEADEDVIIANTQVALQSFRQQGATQVEFVDPLPAADHVGCTIPSLLNAKAWFDSF